MVQNYKNNKVWITKKARMNAEARCLANNNKAIIFLNFYSALLIIISILSIVYNSEIQSLISLFLSIAIMGVSVIIASMDFKEQAIQYKRSYLELMKIEEELDDLENCLDQYNDEQSSKLFMKIKNDYIKILESTPNHKEIDYQKVKRRKESNTSWPILSNYIYNLLYIFILIFPIVLLIYF
ncbi:SLATT domain-containing protein [Mammaliicoccus sciuri]|uniref:SLATT domain-containing protein n=1 Tax=Mammaliicoccus sciuri TaxID=1296 RepID=A0ABT7HZU6_MAMSC|nr:SLATT domain-containing protein [Mammaliicoccus sciuri]MDL0113518.1 SLATT domain-containing protein [Mammaliicoccus sciuri]MDL0117477.1 SLATT domain-containing protein [Mammaliicoccus sciuri]